MFGFRKKRKWEPVVSVFSIGTDKSIEEGDKIREQKSIEELTNAEKVWAFLYGNQNTPISIRKISDECNVPQKEVREVIKNLVADGIVEEPETSRGRGTSYVVRQSPNLTKDSDNPKPDDLQKIFNDVVNIQEALVWDFVRETRSTNILKYLEWLRKEETWNTP